MFRDNLPRADLRRLGHGNFVVVPGRCNHAWGIVLKLPDGPPDHVAHAVNQPHGKRRAVRKLHLGRFLGHKFRLRRHDRPSRTALRQFIPRPFLAVNVFDVGNDLGLHETLDEGGFPGPHRPHHTNVDIARRTGGDILIDRGIHSYIPSFFRSIFMLYFMSGQGKV